MPAEALRVQKPKKTGFRRVPKACYKHLMKSANRTLFRRAPPPTVETDYCIHLHVPKIRNVSFWWQGVARRKKKKMKASITRKPSTKHLMKRQVLNPFSWEPCRKRPERIARFIFMLCNIYTNSLSVNRLMSYFCKKICDNPHFWAFLQKKLPLG